MQKVRKNTTIFWLIFIPMAAVLLSYVLVVVNFFSLHPNNITAKMAVWSFFSTQQKGNMYQEATVDVKFFVDQEDLEFEDESSYRDCFTLSGAVVSEDGFVVVPYHKYLSKSTQIYIYAYSGKVFSGKLVFEDENFYLSILKCENLDGQGGAIAMPYVEISRPVAKSADIFATSVEPDWQTSQRKWSQPWTGQLNASRFDCYYDYRTIDDSYLATDHVFEHFYEVQTQNYIGHFFADGPVFNDYGYFIGLVSSNFELKERVNKVLLPAFVLQDALENVRSAYYGGVEFSNYAAENLKGVSKTELDIHLKVEDTKIDGNIAGMDNSFYFGNAWRKFDEHENILDFYNGKQNGFLLLEDFACMGEQEQQNTIPKYSLIEKVVVNGKTCDVSGHEQLLQVLYGARKGSTVKFYYKTNLQAENWLEASCVV